MGNDIENKFTNTPPSLNGSRKIQHGFNWNSTGGGGVMASNININDCDLVSSTVLGQLFLEYSLIQAIKFDKHKILNSNTEVPQIGEHKTTQNETG